MAGPPAPLRTPFPKGLLSPKVKKAVRLPELQEAGGSVVAPQGIIQAKAARPLRLQVPAAAASSKPAGASPAASAASGRRSPAVGTEDGGAGQRRRGHDPVPGTWPGSREGRSAARRPGRRPGARQPARCPPRLGPDARRLRPAPPEPRGSSSCSGAGARGAGASAAPKLAGEGAMRCARLWGPGPRSGSGERS